MGLCHAQEKDVVSGGRVNAATDSKGSLRDRRPKKGENNDSSRNPRDEHEE